MPMVIRFALVVGLEQKTRALEQQELLCSSLSPLGEDWSGAEAARGLELEQVLSAEREGASLSKSSHEGAFSSSDRGPIEAKIPFIVKHLWAIPRDAIWP